MSDVRTVYSDALIDLLAAAEDAIRQIPPAFPLSATVAVNPFLGQIGEDRATAAARLARVAGINPLRPRAEIAELIEDGRITDADLAAAAAKDDLDVVTLRVAARTPAASPTPHPTVAALAGAATGNNWEAFVEERFGQWAAAAFDEGQALWPAPKGGLFSDWHAFAAHDLSSEIAGLRGFCAQVATLPDCPREAIGRAAAVLGLNEGDGLAAAPIYFHRLLMTMGGWSQVARARGWLAERDGGREDSALALLAIALSWEAALYTLFADKIDAAWAAVREQMAAPVEPTVVHRVEAALQDAADRSAERRLAARLAETAEDGRAPGDGPGDGRADGPGDGDDKARPVIQAAFCIDVRSEVFRRALETTDEGIETIGFAGFFGIASAHRDTASDIVEARAPVLLNPGVESTSATPAEEDIAIRLRHRAVRAWGRFRQAAVSAFAFVEAAGPSYAIKLAKDALGGAPEAAKPAAPVLDLPRETRAEMAAAILGAMSLTRGFAKIVLIAGHGSTVRNAPHASALQCGACGGHAGDVSARLLAGLLNDTAVREDLVAKGIEIPADTVFLAGLHDTVSDRVTLYEDAPTAPSGAAMTRLRDALAAAGRLARAERARLLPRADNPESLPRRGGDWSEVRAEWGLAGCAAFIAAPRRRTAGRDLGGRSFLHSYDWRADDGFGVLELIITAPVVVASWIALQYHGSTVAPEAFGAGNKLLHNVTGGIGVVEGNGGNLRAGLPWQSVHDGEAARHEPVRLAVVIEAPTVEISRILDKYDSVRNLFDNGWLSLHAMDDSGRMAHRYDRGRWIEVDPAALGAAIAA
ncbi:MAG: DUF2309 domain-containing protein [Pseudomonadota bacterium]